MSKVSNAWLGEVCIGRLTCSMVVLTTGQTTTTGMFPVLAYSTVTGRDVSSVLSGVGKSGRHLKR